MKRILLCTCILICGSVMIVSAQNKPIAKLTGGVIVGPIDNSIGGSVSNLPTYPTPYNSGVNTTSLSTLNQFNYQRVLIPQKPFTDQNLVTPTTSAFDVKMTTSYYDGMGRPIQTIKRYENNFNYDFVESYDYRTIRKSTFLYSNYFLPFSSTGNSKFHNAPFDEQRQFYNASYLDEQDLALGMKTYTSDGSKYTTEILSPGKTSVGQKRGVQTYTRGNIINEVILWKIDYSNAVEWPSNSGFYDQASLHATVTFDDNGLQVEQFYDNEDKLILKRILTSYVTCGTNQCPVYSETYYVYDDYDRLRYILSPLASEKLKNTPVSTDIIQNLTSYYLYDQFGRIVSKHTAGQQGVESYVYDRKDRIILSQTPQLAAESKWLFLLYDKLDRRTVSGIINSTNSQSTWQDIANATTIIPSYYNQSDLPFYIVFDQNEGVYPDIATFVPEILTETFYDNYQNPFFAGKSFNYAAFANNISTSTSAIAPPLMPSQRIVGLPTGQRTKIIYPAGMSGPTWTNSVFFYDDLDQMVQARYENQMGGVDWVSMQYDFNGRILRNIATTTNPLCLSKPTTSIITKFEYQARTFKLGSVSQKIDNEPYKLIASNSYDQLGRLNSKNIGDIETQNYSYNLKGQLNGINKEYVEDGIGVKSFGESIKFDFGYIKPRYNGSISGILWRGPNNSPVRSYAFDYDLGERLTDATFKEFTQTSNGMNWNSANTDFSEKGIQYDRNSNIKTLTRLGQTMGPNGIVPGVIDQLSYVNENTENSDRVQKVTDQINLVNQYTDYDFKDGYQGSVDYTYNNDGSLLTDANKGLVIKYNSIQKPEAFEFANGDKIRFIYDALGHKLNETYSGSQTVKKDYLNSIVYKDNVVSFITNQEGYSIPTATSAFDYFFYIKDHQGNIRNILKAEQSFYPKDYYASHEIASANIETSLFDGIPEVRDTKPDSPDPNDQSAARLDGNDPNRRIGTSIVLKVMAGDQFSVSGQSYFNQVESYEAQATGTEMLNSIISTLVNGTGGLEGGAEGNGREYVSRLFSNENYLGQYEAIVNSNTDPTRPKSFINYILFDENFKIIPEESGVIQIGAIPGSWNTVGTNGELTIGRSGYLAVYISSQAKTLSTHWDQLSLYHYVGHLVDENHYYPFGLTVNTSSSNPLKTGFLYESKHLEKVNNLHYYDFGSRIYNPQLGRWNQTDPYASSFTSLSPYSYCANNPQFVVEKDGKVAQIVVLFAIGAGIGATASLVTSVAENGWGTLKETGTWQKAGVGALAGGVTAVLGPSPALTAALGSEVATVATVSGVTSALSSLANDAIDNKPIDAASLTKAGVSGLLGAVGGAIGTRYSTSYFKSLYWNRGNAPWIIRQFTSNPSLGGTVVARTVGNLTTLAGIGLDRIFGQTQTSSNMQSISPQSADKSVQLPEVRLRASKETGMVIDIKQAQTQIGRAAATISSGQYGPIGPVQDPTNDDNSNCEN